MFTDRVGGRISRRERSRCKCFGTGKELSDQLAQSIMLVMGGAAGGWCRQDDMEKQARIPQG